jgi:hypothetical protein
MAGPRPLPTGAIALILLILTAVAALIFAARSEDGGLQLGLVLIMVLPAFTLGVQDSPLLMPYVLGVWAFAPEVRRVCDWWLGEYQPVTVISLTPLIATTALVLPLLQRPLPIPRPLGRALICFGAAFLYAAAVGAAHNGIAFLFDLANYAVPLLILLNAACRPWDSDTKDREIRAFVGLAVAVAAYGWIQFLFAPPWDVLWMKNTPMATNFEPEPMKLRVFSVLNSPVPAASFLGIALAPMLLESRWRGQVGWIGVFVVATALMLTSVRFNWLSLVVTLFVFVFLSRGPERYRRALGVVAAGAVLLAVVPYLPGGQVVGERLQTLSSGRLSDDQSFKDRQELLSTVVPEIRENPFGSGMGAVGQSAKIENGVTGGKYFDFDNGLLAILVTFGVVGSVPFFAGLYLVASMASVARRVSLTHTHARLALATFAAALFYLMSFNLFVGVTAAVIWYVFGTSLGQIPEAPPVKEISKWDRRR